jgi:hypothetical protein
MGAVRRIRDGGITRYRTVCIELVEEVGADRPSHTIIASIPGRESVLRISFGQAGRRLTIHELEDLLAAASRVLSDFVLLGPGVQEVLPL